MIFTTPTEITPGTTGSWQDSDVSAHIPAGSTGVALRITRSDSITKSVGWRKNGSTDNRTQKVGVSNFSVAIGVDANRILELYVEEITYTKIYLTGYFGADAVFFDNATDKTPGVDDTWTDIDISGDTGANTATGAVFEMTGDGTLGATRVGVRKNGSTDARTESGGNHNGYIVGVDGNEICEAYVNLTASVKLYLVGYIKSNATFNTNATDASLATTGSYQNLAALPAGAVGAIVEILNPSNDSVAIREKGAAEDIYLSSRDYGQLIVECDTSQLMEGKISADTVDFYIIGYFTAMGSPSSSISPSLSPSASASPSASVSASSTPSPSISPSSSLSPSASLSPSSSVSSSPSASNSSSTSASPSPSIAPKDFGLKVTKTGYDVFTETDIKNFVFHSGRGVLGLKQLASYTKTTNATGDINATEAHSIGYVPMTIVAFTAYDGSKVLCPVEWHSFYQNGSHETLEVTENVTFRIDATNIRFIVHAEEYNHDLDTTADLASRNYTFDVYYYFNEIVEQT